ncbi:hypothetical protein [Microbacterium caowuchunii]|uniref:Uncharacterized protein n=1 Tax=Microbacterium caowuchunii TaxID=2614638 RepID=A0A5N0TDK9_9MICO|nr:hypothetical protein [Microbacterium caowuchunii]KAA9132167.1 hypothetical protein F6B40_10630 [Microbacterium caowuchunii]
MTAMRISIDGESAHHYSSRLRQQTAGMPDPAAVREVVGNRSESAAANVTARLQNAARSIARHTGYIRGTVAQNAEALTETVAQLQDTDRLSASEAAKGTAIIDGIVVSETPTAPPAVPAAPGTPSQTAGSTGSPMHARGV